MMLRRLLPLLALLALLVAPFGRMAAAEAMAAPAHGAMTTSGHCDDAPGPGHDEANKSIDCMIACAVMAPADAPALEAAPPAAAPLEAGALAAFFGFHPEADPPPPRFS